MEATDKKKQDLLKDVMRSVKGGLIPPAIPQPIGAPTSVVAPPEPTPVQPAVAPGSVVAPPEPTPPVSGAVTNKSAGSGKSSASSDSHGSPCKSPACCKKGDPEH